MAKSLTIPFDELDDHSRDYLARVRSRKGNGMPGAYVPVTDALPGVGCFFGIVVLLGMFILSFQLMEEEPLGVAMLQTIGVLLGGWLILYAFRVWSGGKKYVGSFVYADSQTLWECGGSTVAATDLTDLREARGVQNFSSEGKYTNTAVTVQTGLGSKNFTVNSENRARDFITFLNVLAWMRSGGKGEPTSDDDFDFRKLPPHIMGGLAKETAEQGDMPRKFSAESLGLEVDDVPTPRHEGRGSSGIIAYLLIIAVAVGGVFVFKELNVGWRDEAIWSQINQIPESEKRAPWLRAYIADVRNVKHRDEAKTMLAGVYRDAISRIKNQGGIVPMGVPNPNRTDPALLEGLELILKEIATQPLAVVTIRVKEENGGESTKQREKEVLMKYTKAVEDGVGQELIAFAEAPEGAEAMVEIQYTMIAVPNNFNNYRVNFTLNFRKNPDAKVEKSATQQKEIVGNDVQQMGRIATELGLSTAGPKKPEPPPQLDF